MGDILKRLSGPTLLTASAATQYTVPALTTATVRNIHVTNETGTAATFTLSIGTDGAGKRLWYQTTIPANGFLDWSGVEVLATTEIIQALSGTASALTLTMSGVETTLDVSSGGYKGVAFKRRTSGHQAFNSATMTNYDTGTDLVLPATTGDVIEVSLSMIIGSEGIVGRADVATVVAGSPVNYFSSGTGASAGTANGVSAWRTPGNTYTGIGAPVCYTLQAGDISSGTVTLRLRVKTDGGSLTHLSDTDYPMSWSAKNLGPPAS